MEMECSPLTVHRKAPVRGLIGPGNGGFPCGIDNPRALATDADLHSLIYDCWEMCIEISPILGNEEAPGKVRRFHATLAAESAILWFPFVFVPYQNSFLFSPPVRKLLQRLA